jgi:hypothetical protein
MSGRSATLTMTWRTEPFAATDDAFVALRRVPQHTTLHIRLELHAIRTPHSTTTPALFTDLAGARRAAWLALAPDAATSTPLVAQFTVPCARAGSFRIFAARADDVDVRHSPVVDLVVTAAIALPWQPACRLAARDLALQTFLTKQLGPLSLWRSRILGPPTTATTATTAADSRIGVNAIHFTPLEARGQSDSAYSIADQLRYDARLFADSSHDLSLSADAQDERVRTFLAALRTEARALLFADIVLNHTADNSPWLAEQPDAAYNTRNSPHLRVAYALDCAMLDFSAALERERRNAVRSHADVDALVAEFFDRFLPPRRLADHCVDDAQRAALADDLRVARDNITRRVAYLRLDADGPRHGDIGVRQPLVESYFTTLVVAAAPPLGLAHNGWMWGASGVDDFAAPHSHAYIRREVIIWSDSIKLRYGAQPADSPWLWAHMEQYVRRTARVFDGLRIDNCHNTPMHVAEHFIDVARAERPDIFVVAELFTGSERTDALWSARLGLSALIREAVHPTNATELAHLCHRFGVERAVGEVTRVALEPGHVSLEPRMPPALFTDCTHDNETPAQRQTAEHSLALLALTLMTHAAAGTVRGFDQFVPRTIDLVRDTRQYAALDADAGLVGVRRRFLALRRYMAERGGFDEAYVHRTDETIFITRHNIADGEALVLVAHTAFRGNGAQSIAEFDVDGRRARAALWRASVARHRRRWRRRRWWWAPTRLRAIGGSACCRRRRSTLCAAGRAATACASAPATRFRPARCSCSNVHWTRARATRSSACAALPRRRRRSAASRRWSSSRICSTRATRRSGI